MKLTETYIKENYNVKAWDWGQNNLTLKNKYKSEYHSEVKTYKLSKKEMEEYLKKFK